MLVSEKTGVGGWPFAFRRIRKSERAAASSALQSGQSQAGRVAYLVNVYPKVSHSFIQTEIAALERLGMQVDRFTIRRAPDAMRDAKGVDERHRTTALLDDNVAGLAGALMRRFVGAPFDTGRLFLRTLMRPGGAGCLKACAYLVEAIALVEHMEARGVRHVHVHFGTNPAAVARLAARIAPISYSVTVHGPDEFDAPIAIDLPGKIADAAFVVGISSYGRGQLMRWSRIEDWPKIQVVRCAVARSFLRDPQRAADDNVPDRFVCVARLNAQKGLPLLIAAAARIAPKRTFTIDIIGDGEERAALTALIARLGLEGCVRLVGWRSPEGIRSELEGARALVLPSFAEGLPVVLMEAMAMGCPVVTTAIAGIPELVDRETGWLIRAGCVDALADAMEAALDTPVPVLRRMGAVGRARVLDMHDPDSNARILADQLLRFT